MTKLENFIGKWMLVESKNYDNLMIALGVNIIKRKFLSKEKPYIAFEVNGDTWTMTTITTIKTHNVNFKLNEEFSEETVDGRNCKVVFKNS